MTDLETIAIAIGHHFWTCKTDEEAKRCGMDAAKDVAAALWGEEKKDD